MKISNIVSALMLLVSSTFASIVDTTTRSISYCNEGGIYLNNSLAISMCWGDNEVYADWMMTRQGFVRVYDYPSSPDAFFYKGGLVFGNDVEFVRLLFRDHRLIEIYAPLQNNSENISYREITTTYCEFESYFKDKENGYSLIKETNIDSIFEPSNLICAGSCGSMEHLGKYISVELFYFISGKAKRKAFFRDSLSVASISIEVPTWDLIRYDGVDKFSLKWPHLVVCFSEPKGTLSRLNEKNKRRRLD